ncbi:tRNA (N6-threonylcarbamoyladenosine(37)-N6)-methyltransferase TrmO [uncultured Ruthenibacterium sp.]|uniref:tRNA (N6-threonylcarbamoyladenosine(37)-N6)-methyltransferase TrmO n=1 Tax=uncultured Ruthenibacterium sp. TaxID=1905347 RepID=UPI00349F0135
MDLYSLEVIARIHSDFPGKFGIPRQSGLVDELKAQIIFEPKFRNLDAIRGLEEFSHIWLIWQFSLSLRDNWSATVRPPRLGGNKRIGVFATRSPFRPNALALSSVRLESIKNHPHLGPVLYVSGADLADGTPIFDIKPYLAFTDSHPDAVCGFADRHLQDKLTVHCPEELAIQLPLSDRQALFALLAQDPRPSYQDDPERIYGFPFAGYEIHFTVRGKELTVKSITKQ